MYIDYIQTQGCQRNMEDWQRILQVRSLILSQQDDIQSWIKFASICLKNGKLTLSERTLTNLLNNDPDCNIDIDPLSVKFPQVLSFSLFLSLVYVLVSGYISLYKTQMAL